MAPDLESLVHHDVLPDGKRVLMRPLCPNDAALYPEFVAHVTPQDSRLRFFSAIRELSEERIAQLTHLDYSRAMAFIALDEATAKMLGVVRLHLDDERKSGEFAVIVRSELKRPRTRLVADAAHDRLCARDRTCPHVWPSAGRERRDAAHVRRTRFPDRRRSEREGDQGGDTRAGVTAALPC